MILATSFECPKIINILDVMNFALTAIQWIAPVLLILWGTIDLVKSVVAGKEEDIKKYQKVLVKRVISAVIIFLIPLAVKLLLGLLGTDEWKCCWEASEPRIIGVNESIGNETRGASCSVGGK